MGAIGGIARPSGTLVPRGLSHSGESVGTSRTGQAAARGRQDDEVEDQSVGKARQNHAARGSELRHFAAGGCGGMMGALLTCPLEVVKTHLQSKAVLQRSISDVVLQIARADGVVGFWRGIGPMLAGVVPARAVNFWTYNAVKGRLLSAGHPDGPLVHMAGGIVGGTVTVTVVNPVWVIKTRLQLQGAGSEGGTGQVYRGSLHAFRQILQEEGVRGFYKGLIPSIWGVSETAIQFVIYERLKSMLIVRHQHWAGVREDNSQLRGRQAGDKPELRNLEYVGAAASAKVVASISTYPHEVIRTRLRERGASEIYKSAVHCLRKVWVDEGMRGLYGGLFTHLLRVVPNTAILFFTYEKVSKFLDTA